MRLRVKYRRLSRIPLGGLLQLVNCRWGGAFRLGGGYAIKNRRLLIN